MCGWSDDCGYCAKGCIFHSGFKEDLADGECKPECNNALCAFDAGDCVPLTQGTCAAGCFEEMVGDGTCQPECLVETCDNDAGDCIAFQCAAECFSHMIGNGKCEEVCDVEACSWDGSDCGCSAGCTAALLSNTQCDPLCANAPCNFDNGQCECAPGCADQSRGNGVCDPECFTAACENDNGDCECAPGCLYSDIGQCKPECQAPECNYDMVDPAHMFCQNSFYPIANCQSAMCFDFEGSDFINCNFICDQCGFVILYKMNCCSGCCSENYFAHPQNPNICVRTPDHTTEQRPRIIYVGTGEESHPSLSAAFASIFEKYVEVRLLPGTHKVTRSKYFIGYHKTVREDETHTEQVDALKRLKITSQSCATSSPCQRAVILSSDIVTRPYFVFSGNRRVEISNVEFVSTLPQSLCRASGLDCASVLRFFDLSNGAFMKLLNVTIRDFKDSMKSIVMLNSASLVLENVDFIGVMLQGNVNGFGLITSQDSSIKYTNGSISLTNNLWDYNTLKNSEGALQAIGGDITIDGVRMTHNFMALAGEDSVLASLVIIRDCWHVLIANCDFAFNVGRRGAVLSLYTYRWGVMSANYETTMAALESSIVVANCTFRNNTGSIGSSIYVLYASGQQNVLITNCTFLNEFAEKNSVIAFYSRQPTTEILSKKKHIVTMSGALKTVEYPVPRLVISNSQFRNCNPGLFGLIALENIWNVRIEHISVEDASMEDARNVTTNSLQVLLTVPSAHVPRFAPPVSPQQCQSLFNFTSSAFLEIEHLSVTRSACTNIMTVTSLNFSISSSYFGWNRGTAPSGFIINSESRAITMKEVVVEGNENENLFCKGAVYLTGTAVNISSSRFARNAASQGAGLFLDSVQSVEVRDCVFEFNSANVGGAVFIEGNVSIAITALSSVFRNNSAAQYGGAVYIAPKNRQLYAKVTLVGTVFERCHSATGSAMFISEGVVLLPGTQYKDCKFTDNVASQYGACVFELINGELAFASCQFARNIGTFSSALQVSYPPAQATHLLTLTDILFDRNEASSTVLAAAVEVAGASVACRNNVGTCLLFESANFTCTNCSFGFNSAMSGAALQFHAAQAACEDCHFQSNSAEFTGGAVLVKSYSLFTCRRCLFQNNTAQWQGGALFAEQQSSVRLEATDLISNNARGGGFAVFLMLSGSQSVVRASRFAFNEGTGNGCISLIAASVELEDCDWTENASTDLMGGLMLSQSTARIASCRFTKQTGVSGVFVSALSSNVTIADSLLANSTATDTAAGMALVSSQVSISRCTFEFLASAFGGAITLQEKSSISVQRCSFSHIHSKATNRGVFTAIRSSLSISHSRFSSYNERGIYGVQASVTVSDSSFADGGGVACTRCSLASIESCSFERLSAERGAAVFLDGSGDNFLIADSHFLQCRGKLSGAVHIEGYPGSISGCRFLNNSGGRGGAIHIAKSSAAVDITDNRFQSNTAASRGGAVSWEGVQPTLQNNKFIDNEAIYGPDVASYAIKMAVVGGYSTLANISSGRPLDQPLALELLDIYGQVLADDNESVAQLTTDDNETAVSGEVRVQALRGQFLFTDCSVFSRPGSNTSVSITTSAIERARRIPVLMRYCAKGEYLALNQCVPCAPGTYSLTNHSSCSNCPSSALCFGNFTIVPKPGFWRPTSDSHLLFKCPNTDACKGSPNGTSLTGVCASGYEGAKCQACAHGHYQWGTIHCSKCWDETTRLGVHVLVAVVLASGLGVLIGLVLLSCAKVVLYIKIFVHYVQVVMLFRSAGIVWPQRFLQLFNAYEVFGAFPEYVISANCMMENYYGKLLAVSFAQPAFVLVAFVIWSLIALVKRSRRYLQDEFVSTAVAISFLAHPSVIRTMLESFRCEEVELGQYWLLEHNLQCWTPEHTRFSLGVALPCIILYGFAVPALIMRLLRREQSESVRFRYTTLGYSNKRWYWEFVVLFWKTLVVGCLSALFHVSKLFPALSVLGMLIVAVGVLASRRRKEPTEYNPMEVQMLTVCASTLYLGLALSTGVLDGTASMVPFGVVLFMNVYFTGVLILRVCVVLYRQIKKRIHPANEDHN